MSLLVSDIFGLRSNEDVSAQMALETPQIMIRWRYEDLYPDVDLISIRRSLWRFPESLSEGDAILDEVPTSQVNKRTSYSDTTVEPYKVYYYTTFFTCKGPFSMGLDVDPDARRLGILRGAWLQHFGGILDKCWVIAREEGGNPYIWLYDFNKNLVEERIDLSQIIAEREERVVSIIRYSAGPPRDFELVTDRRWISLQLDPAADEALPSDIVGETNFLGILTPGFTVRGATRAGTYITVLDTDNREIKWLTTGGSVLATTDISGLSLDGELFGLSYNASGGARFLLGSGKVIYGFYSSNLTPTNDDIKFLYPVRQTINCDFHYDNLSNKLILPNDDLDVLQRYSYTSDLVPVSQIEEAQLPGINPSGSGTVALWKLGEESGDAVDYSGKGYDGTINGSPTRAVEGKFGNAIQFTSSADYIDISVFASDFDPDDGIVKFWYKAPYEGFVVSSTHYKLFKIRVDASNELSLRYYPNGNLMAYMLRGGTTTIVSATMPNSFDDGGYHAFEVRWIGGSGGTLYLYYDGVLLNSGAMSGTWSGSPSDSVIGGTGGLSLIGFYDDFMIGVGVFSTFTRYQVVTDGYRSHALSGRDYDEPGQHWRDMLRYEFGEFILRNDFRVIALPQDKELFDNEVLFRQATDDMTLGELSRLARLFGLFLDRNVDRQKFFLNHLTARSCEYEFIDDLGELINAGDMDPDWNVEVQRRHLEVMYYAFQRSGTLDAFARLVRHLGFRMLLPDDLYSLIQVYRRYFDSVVNPLRPDVPFDTSFFDSYASDIPFLTVYFKFFQENYSSSVGSTSVPATRELNDAGASFLSDAEPGSFILINDQDSTGDNGQYLVDSVTSDTKLVVDRDWPTGSLSSLSYRLHWRIPPPDPYNDQILTRLNLIKARWQELEVIL